MSVKIAKTSIFKFSASKALDKSLSITASIPINLSFSFTTGIPPPPHAITIFSSFTKSLIDSSSIISIGFGEGTTLL